jgi:hypothetical protein
MCGIDLWDGLSALNGLAVSLPGALPQAGMKPRLRRSIPMGHSRSTLARMYKLQDQAGNGLVLCLPETHSRPAICLLI